MPKRPVTVRRAAGYFPLAVFDQLEKRAAKHFHSVSREVVQIIGEVLQKEVQQQEQQKEVATA